MSGMRYVSHSTEETIAFGERLGSVLADGDVLILTGDLGAGKTQLTKGIARSLGIADDVTSPTFTILNIHEGTALRLYHFDLYRLEGADALYEMGLEEYIPARDGVTFIEWPEMAEEAMPEDALTVCLTYGEDGLTRSAELTPSGAFTQARIDEILQHMEACHEYPDD